MIANIILFIRALMMLGDFIKWLKGTISDAEFNAAVSHIKADTTAAQTGSLDDRLKGGQDVTNDFNKHT